MFGGNKREKAIRIATNMTLSVRAAVERSELIPLVVWVTPYVAGCVWACSKLAILTVYEGKPSGPSVEADVYCEAYERALGVPRAASSKAMEEGQSDFWWNQGWKDVHVIFHIAMGNDDIITITPEGAQILSYAKSICPPGTNAGQLAAGMLMQQRYGMRIQGFARDAGVEI
jgi:hypothetical protein